MDQIESETLSQEDKTLRGPPQACVFVASITTTTTEDKLQNYFANFGKVLKVKLLKDKAMRPYAFVQFLVRCALGWHPIVLWMCDERARQNMALRGDQCVLTGDGGMKRGVDHGRRQSRVHSSQFALVLAVLTLQCPEETNGWIDASVSATLRSHKHTPIHEHSNFRLLHAPKSSYTAPNTINDKTGAIYD